MKKTVDLFERRALTSAQIARMWDIYKSFYDYTYESFLDKLETNTMYALYSKDDEIAGFTGLRINELKVGGKTHFMIYIGQTILPGGLKGKQLFPLTVAKLVLRFWKKILFSSTWVWFDALTFKAYWIPAKVGVEFYPSRTKAMLPDVIKVMNYIGRHYYGDSYCEKTNTVCKPKPFVKLAYREIPQRLMSDADVAFYAASNPGYKMGHGLLTTVPMNLRNKIIILRSLFEKRNRQNKGLKPWKNQPPKTIQQHENTENVMPAYTNPNAVAIHPIQPFNN